MRHLTILSCFLLMACANDRYAPTSGDPVRMASALHGCKLEAIHDSIAKQNQGVNILAGAAGGAVGGLISGLAQQSQNNPNLQIEACMRAHGYEGTSEN